MRDNSRMISKGVLLKLYLQGLSINSFNEEMILPV